MYVRKRGFNEDKISIILYKHVERGNAVGCQV
jgi:hypothetical protein